MRRRAALWDLRPSAALIVDVTVPGTGSRNRKGLRIHRARDLTGQTTTCDGIPVTTPARTILDLAATLQRRPLERVLDQAENLRLTDVPSLAALARAHAGHRGASRLWATLGAHEPGTTLTRSQLEERFLELCRDAGLRRPKVNARVSGPEVDFTFPRAPSPRRDRQLALPPQPRRLRARPPPRRPPHAGRLPHPALHPRPALDRAGDGRRHGSRRAERAEPGYPDPMSDQHSGDAGETAREMREHEREARERDADERDPATGVDTESTGGAEPDVASEPAPPGNVQTGEVSGGS